MFILYLVFMLGIGIWFFVRSKNAGEKDYFLGGREMGAWVSGLSAGASDMSAWVLMGMPASIYAYGMGKAWIPVGLFIGYSLSWIFIAPRLRSFSIVCGDSITIPQYLTNRFKASSRALQIICAVIFLVAYTVYSASSIKACGTLFETVLGVPAQIAMYAAAVIIVGYTFLGGFNAVCWTDFFQGLLMLGSLFAAPIVALCMMQKSGTTAGTLPAGYWNMMTSWQDILSGLGWGLGYAGMPHIIIRFMSVKSDKELKKAAKVGIGWTFFILMFAVLVSVVAHLFLGDGQESSTIFIAIVRRIFTGPWLGLISGLLLSAILAGAMSTADSQLLAASSAFASDVYKPVIRKGQSTDKEMLWVGRIVVLVIAAAALLIASGGDVRTALVNLIFYALFAPACGQMINRIMYMSEAVMEADEAIGRLDEILSQQPMKETKVQKRPADDAVAFDHVTFTYPGADRPALEDVSFSVQPGQVVALVGPSGGGKSTAASLIPRFWDVDSGSVTVGGADVRELAGAALMGQVAFVFQDTRLFKESLLENIRAARPDASREEVLAAAHAAQCDDILEKLPQGLDTVVGARGVYLSGGEQQRIALARAILKDAPIVVLDEATAFADPENEHQIQKAFETLTLNKTVLMIAHRLSTVQNADNIIVLSEGKIAEQGSHSALLTKNGVYAAMWADYQRSAQWKVGKEAAV